ncbi:ACT domain-containing protein [Striga asiatica]|uniref:ACT domain-containing protein ACR n=2 Tax=Striga asiatica TaxID=4170 RepID=A0A5A7PE64_STRAF|nr:ACT domain-containing protein [Striga asiatica]
MLLEMVQVLTDLDLVISKSYISSDGGWLMDVFHVTDQLGHKLTDTSLIDYIQEGICASRQARKDAHKLAMCPRHVLTEHMALEMTGVDRPGLMSEITAVLSELACHVTAAVAWTHNGRVACIIYLEEDGSLDPCRVAQVQAQVENVVEAHHHGEEQRSVQLAGPAPGRTHTERRLHQLLAADSDYEACCSCCGGNSEGDDFYVYGGCHKGQKKGCDGTHVRIENCKAMGYSVINIRSRDRTKLLFDTLCVLTDLQYVVYHAAISSHGSTAFQEYYVRHKDGHVMISECEKHMVTKCLIAATERRASHGLRVDICTKNRTRLLSDVTRVFRENGLSIKRAEIGVRGDKAVGTFYMMGDNVNMEIIEAIRQEIGGDVMFEIKSGGTTPEVSPTRTSTNSSMSSNGIEERPRFSLGNLLWSQLERLSSNFRPIKP